MPVLPWGCPCTLGNSQGVAGRFLLCSMWFWEDSGASLPASNPATGWLGDLGRFLNTCVTYLPTYEMDLKLVPTSCD